MRGIYLLLPFIALSCQKKESLQITGSCVPSNTLEIRSEITGRLLSTHATEGKEVAEGDLLFTIDSKMYEATRDRVIAERLQNIAKLQYAAEKVARYKTLLPENYVSQLDYIQYVSTLADLEAAVMKNEADIRIATINLDACQIKAPFRGIVGKQVSKGSLITSSRDTLATLSQSDPMYIDFHIPKEIIDLQSLTIDLPELIDKPLIIDERILRIKVSNADHKFWPGQSIKATLSHPSLSLDQ